MNTHRTLAVVALGCAILSPFVTVAPLLVAAVVILAVLHLGVAKE